MKQTLSCLIHRLADNLKEKTMSAASNYLENKLLDHTLRGAAGAYTAPTTLYVALFLNTSGQAATNLEANATSDEVTTNGTNGYIRKAITFNPASNGTSVSAATVTFDPCLLVNWGTITHVAIMDAVTAGNVIFWGGVTSPKTIEVGDTFQITAGSLTISLA